MQGQLLSDLLNQEKICQLFQDEEEQPENKKQQISLNFTVTSRQNNDLINSNKMKLGSNSFFQQAKASLGQYQNWCTKKLDNQNKQLIDKLTEIGQITQKKKPHLLSMPPLHLLRECQENKENRKKSFRKESCQKCKQKDETILIFQSNIKQLQGQIQNRVIMEVKQQILDSVEINLLKEKNQQMRLQIQLLKQNVEKTNLQKSTLFDKTKDLQKRLGCLQKSFSNAKNSTNPTNANDTMNRQNSIISFDNYETNTEEQVRFLEKLRDKYLNLLNQDLKELSINCNMNISKQEQMNMRKKSLYYPIYSYSRSIVQKLRVLKKPNFYHNNDCDHSSYKQINQNRSLNMKIASLEKNIQNLRKSYQQLKILYEESLKKNQQLQKIRQSFTDFQQQYEEKVKKIKSSARRMLAEEKNKMMNLVRKIQQEKLLLMYQLQDLKGSIRVYCRIRPRLGNQKKYPSILQANSSSIHKDNKKFQFSHVFNEQTTQFQIFKETSRLVECAFEGRNLCIFAYGQTGSGKTYTLHGTQDEPGLAPNIIQQVFNSIENNKQLYNFNISMGMIEIYLENLYDLYGIVPIGTKIQIKEDKNMGIYLQNCPLITFNSRQQMMKVYVEGIQKRKKRQTQKNDESSRSHCITIINVVKENKKTKQSKHSKIILIDLAGAQKNTSSNPIIARQTNFINSSLSNLATVFSAMKNKEHVPYRNCKLTHILKDSLTSKGKILMFINVSPAQNNNIETQRTLQFGKRVQKVQRNERYEKVEDGQIYKKVEKQRSRRGSTKLSMG